MKKLILSMFIVLGTMASVQAQSFNFSCSTLSTAAPGYGQTFVPTGFTQTQADVLFDLGLETSSNDPHFTYPIMIGDASIIVVEGPSDTYEVYDEHGGGDFAPLPFDTFEEATAYVSSLLPQGFTIDQALDLVDDGVVYTTLPADNGCGSCVSKRRFQGAFRADNGDVQTFILSVTPEGANHQLHDADGNPDGFGPHNYSITGHNFTAEYFLDIDIAIARAMELNTRG